MRRFRTAGVALFAAALLLGAVACSENDTVGENETPLAEGEYNTETGAMGDQESPATGMGETGDAAITTKVKSALAADPDTQALEIDVDTENGVVTLTGSVEDEASKQQAEQIARGVDGVTSVQNQLSVGERSAMGFGDQDTTADQRFGSAGGATSEDNRLPQTGTSLPLIGLIGFLALGVGLATRFALR